MKMNKSIFLTFFQIVMLAVANIPASADTYNPPIMVEHKRSTYSNNSKELAQLLTQREAKVVYQCDDGICKKLIGEETPILLTNNGTYPRWSPDGKWIAFVRGNTIMRMTANGKKIQMMARAIAPRAVAWTFDGRVIFTDGHVVKAVHSTTLTVETLITGPKFFEIDMVHSTKGDILAATVKTNFSYQVKIFDLKTGKKRTIARGCSASLSPDGRLVTVNTDNHKQLDLYQAHSGIKKGHINAPSRFKFDNHFWSTSQNWIVSQSEGKYANIFVHHVPTNRVWQVTFTDNCDRPDLYIASN